VGEFSLGRLVTPPPISSGKRNCSMLATVVHIGLAAYMIRFNHDQDRDVIADTINLVISVGPNATARQLEEALRLCHRVEMPRPVQLPIVPA
jgi:hypothetical protein